MTSLFNEITPFALPPENLVERSCRVYLIPVCIPQKSQSKLGKCCIVVNVRSRHILVFQNCLFPVETVGPLSPVVLQLHPLHSVTPVIRPRHRKNVGALQYWRDGSPNSSCLIVNLINTGFPVPIVCCGIYPVLE